MQSIGKRARTSKKPRVATIMRNVQRHNRMVAVPVQLMRTGGRLPTSGMELKNIDVAGIAFPAAAAGTGVVTPLNLIPQDSTANGRVGRRVTLKSILIKGEVRLAATSAGTTPLRILVVYDKQTNAAAAVATDVLNLDLISSPNQLSNSRRFVTLFDHYVPCLGTAGPQSVYINLYKKLNLVEEFNTGTTGVIGAIQTGAIYAITYTGTGLLTAALVSGLTSRIRYADN